MNKTLFLAELNSFKSKARDAFIARRVNDKQKFDNRLAIDYQTISRMQALAKQLYKEPTDNKVEKNNNEKNIKS